MILLCIINAEEERHIDVIDTLNAFIQTRVENENKMSVINIRGILVNLILETDPELYGTFVTTDKKIKKVIILQYMDTIYGTVVDSLIYYKKFVKTLKTKGLQLNQYDLT